MTQEFLVVCVRHGMACFGLIKGIKKADYTFNIPQLSKPPGFVRHQLPCKIYMTLGHESLKYLIFS